MFTNFAIRHEYATLAAPDDRRGEAGGLIDRDAFRPLIYTRRVGRPNYDFILMVKPPVLPQWGTGASGDRSSSGTLRPFRIGRRSGCSGKDTAIREEFQRQPEAQGLPINRGVMQDASFTTADPGHPTGRPGRDAAQPRRRLAEEGVKHGRADPPDRDHHRIGPQQSDRSGTVYRGKGSFGMRPQASMDRTIHRATRGRSGRTGGTPRSAEHDRWWNGRLP